MKTILLIVSLNSSGVPVLVSSVAFDTAEACAAAVAEIAPSIRWSAPGPPPSVGNGPSIGGPTNLASRAVLFCLKS